MLNKFFILIGMILVSLFPINAQIFKYIGMDNGLSSRRVLSIEQGKQYYIWILTHKGQTVTTGNGSHITTCSIKEKPKTSIPTLTSYAPTANRQYGK